MKKQKMKISKSTRTYIRRQKQEIRQSGVAIEEQLKQIDILYKNLAVTK